MRIHAYRRKEAFTVDLTPVGQAVREVIEFTRIAENPPTVVADVEDQRHIDVLLNIPEAYREFSEKNRYAPASMGESDNERAARDAEARRVAELREQEAKAQKQREADRLRAEAAASGKLAGSTRHEDLIDLTGRKTVDLADVIQAAHRNSALSREEWNELEPDERDALITRQIEVWTADAEREEAAEQDALAEQVKREKAEAAAAEAAKKDGAATGEAAAGDEAQKKFLLEGEGGKQIDLGEMSPPEVRAFAKKYDVDIPTGLRDDGLRQFVYDALTTPAAGSEQARA